MRALNFEKVIFKACFFPLQVDDFRPENVPTVNQLVDELDKSSKDENNASNVEDYDKTSLKGPMKVFEAFLRDLQ